MITNWDIVSRIDHATNSIHYTLLMDGTENDARLIIKKLKGYIGQVTPAQAPYVYACELPADMDEGTQNKIRTATEEGVALTNKVNQFIPGGSLGDPLFNINTKTEDKGFPSFLTLDPSSSVFEDSSKSAPAKRPTLDLSTEALSAKDTPPSQTNTRSLPTGLSSTARNVFSSKKRETPAPEKSEEIEDLSPKQDWQPVQIEQRTIPAEQMHTTPPPKVNSTISISDNDMLIKDMEGSMLEKMPLKDILSADTKYDMFVDVEKKPQEVKNTQEQKNQKIQEAGPIENDSFNVFENELKEQTNVIDVEEVQNITDRLAKKDMNFMKQSQDPKQDASASPTQANANTEAEQATVPFTLGAAEEEHTPILSDLSSETLPEEEMICDTIPPQQSSDDPLPEITVRADIDKLDKTFNLETTFNTEFLKRQNEKNRSLQEGKEPPQEEQTEPRTKTILRLKKQAPAPQPAQTNPNLGKTILRLRRKSTATSATPENPPAAKTLRNTMSPDHVAANTRAAKQKSIDHSIEIPISELRKHNWPLEVPLVPTYTLNNMVMSVNRFAHATAISVIENPGHLYNPLVLHGGPGTGKTHFLNALAYAFSKKFGQEHIFMTNGVRLSRGIQRYVMEGNINKFENFMQSVQVLLIDDIHLLAINEQNRDFVSKLLNSFLKEHKQIVITSKYPPESLEKLEELIKFKLDAGWISELKPATGATHFRIVKKMLAENGVDLNDKQIEEFFSAPHMTLGTVTRSIRRLKVLENLIFPNVPQEQKSQAGIFEKLLATKGEDKTSELMVKDPQEITSISTIGNGEWGRIGFFYPQHSSDMMSWMVYALEQRSKELGIEGGFEIVVRSSYSTENIISSAFKIANLCDNKKLKGAVILGPLAQECDPSVRENFYDILTHMLEIMLIRCGIINFEDVRQPSTYVKVISELMR